MGDKQQEYEASVELAFQIAERHAGELLPDVLYGKERALACVNALKDLTTAQILHGDFILRPPSL